jgi:hydrogenase maturation protease
MGLNRSERVLVLGLGNTIMSDDGVGIYVVRRVRELLELSEPVDAQVDVEEAELAGFGLMDLLEGYGACVIIDAVEWADMEPGEIRQLALADFAPTVRLAAGHQIDLPTALALGKTLNRTMPDRVVIIAVQVKDPRLFGERCTDIVTAAIDPAAKLAVRLARRLIETSGQ